MYISNFLRWYPPDNGYAGPLVPVVREGRAGNHWLDAAADKSVFNSGYHVIHATSSPILHECRSVILFVVFNVSVVLHNRSTSVVRLDKRIETLSH